MFKCYSDRAIRRRRFGFALLALYTLLFFTIANPAQATRDPTLRQQVRAFRYAIIPIGALGIYLLATRNVAPRRERPELMQEWKRLHQKLHAFKGLERTDERDNEWRSLSEALFFVEAMLPKRTVRRLRRELARTRD